MNLKQLLITLSALIMTHVATAFAADYGTAAEAKAMLEKAVAAIKANKSQALANFAKGESGFKDRDLYPFCIGADAKFSAHPTLGGTNAKDLKDKAGKPIGEEFLKVAQEGKISEVDYMWPRPGSTEPVQKVSFVTKVGDQICAVGYYK